MRRPGRARPIGVAIALAAGVAGACSESTGLKITVDPGDFHEAATLRVEIHAEGGFKMKGDDNVSGIRVTTQDLDGDGEFELVANINGPFSHPVEFRVATGNHETIKIQAEAKAFNTVDLIASATGDASLSGGGESTIALQLMGAAPGPIGPNTRTTDLRTDGIDVVIQGHEPMVKMSSLAVCDVDGDMHQDIVIGAPNDEHFSLGGTGAVYVVWGGWPSKTVVDLSPDPPIGASRFFGVDSGDHLGTAVACVDLNGDGYGDIIAGAPDADGGHGRVYVVFGQLNFKGNRAVDLTSATKTADITWTTTAADAALGSVLHAVVPGRGVKPEVLVAAPGAAVTHVFANITQPAAPEERGVDAADHPTITGVAAAALAAGDLAGDTANGGEPLDITIGDPTYRLPSDGGSRRGIVYLFSNVSPTGTAALDVAAATTTIEGPSLSSQLGSALLIADTSGKGEDLLVGAPTEGSAGVVFLFKHDDGFFLPSKVETSAAQPITGYEPGGFGAALGSTRPGSASGVGVRLVIGAPGVSRPDRMSTGAAYLFNADADRTFRIFEQVYGAGAQDLLGTAVAGGQLDDGAVGDMVTAAPQAAGGVPGTGVVYVRYGQ